MDPSRVWGQVWFTHLWLTPLRSCSTSCYLSLGIFYLIFGVGEGVSRNMQWNVKFSKNAKPSAVNFLLFHWTLTISSLNYPAWVWERGQDILFQNPLPTHTHTCRQEMSNSFFFIFLPEPLLRGKRNRNRELLCGCCWQCGRDLHVFKFS